jgi:hypothetical protein
MPFSKAHEKSARYRAKGGGIDARPVECYSCKSTEVLVSRLVTAAYSATPFAA